MRQTTVILIFMFLIPLGCNQFKKFNEKGLLDQSSLSVFQLYAGKACKITNEDESKEVNASCENLRNFIDADSSYCTDGPFKPAKGIFPDQSNHMRLCVDRSNPKRKKKKSLRILALADTGAGQNVKLGTGQYIVADAMRRICFEQSNEPECDFAIIAGDLIYPRGVDDVFDGDFRDKFEKVYANFSDLKFYMVPGNHDHYGNVTADVEYTYFSDRWVMPNRHFAMPDLPDWLTIYGLDTTAMADEEDINDTTAEQTDAFKETMCSSSAKWKILFGHHPSVSHGAHGAEEITARKITNLWNECNFNLYLTAHDHIQEHIHSNIFDTIIQGGGGGKLSTVTNTNKTSETGDPELGRESFVQRFAKATYGFALIDIDASSMHVRFYATDTWRPKDGEFQDPVRLADHIYECRWKQGDPEGCK